MSSYRSGLLPVVLTATALLSAGCQGDQQTAAGATPAAGGKCRFVSAAEMAQVVGVAAVKPVETAGGCSYLLDPADVMPSLDPAAATFPPLPPSIDFSFYTDQVAINAFAEDLKNPGEQPVSDLDAPARWLDDDGEQLHQLTVRTSRGVVRINVMPPGPPQHLRTDDRVALAKQIYTIARPRLT